VAESPRATPAGTAEPIPTSASHPVITPAPTSEPSSRPQPTPAPTRESASAFGQVEVATTVNSYQLDSDRITGFTRLRLEAPISAIATAPRRYPFPTFSDPRGVKRLVRIVDGPFRGVWLSPDDPGVVYRP
jgi:hypothetical protein